MQSAVNVNETDVNLVTAEVLREMTITKEDLFERQKNSVLDALMSSMTRIASEQGGRTYVANLNPQFDPVLMTSITEKLQELGYSVTVETRTDEKLGSFVSLAINW